MSELSPKEYPIRTAKQSRALHVLFQLLANELNDNGLDMKRTLKEHIDIPWSGASVKEWLWKPVQKAQLNKDSTTKLTTVEIDQVFDTLVKHLGEQFGISINFPSIEQTMFEIEAERRARLEQSKKEVSKDKLEEIMALMSDTSMEEEEKLDQAIDNIKEL